MNYERVDDISPTNAFLEEGEQVGNEQSINLPGFLIQ